MKYSNQNPMILPNVIKRVNTVTMFKYLPNYHIKNEEMEILEKKQNRNIQSISEYL